MLDGVTENVQTQINAKADDSKVVHLTGNETIAGTKTFTGGVVMKGGADVASSGNAVLNVEGVATDTDYIDMYVSGGTNKTRPLVLQNNSAGTGNVGIGTATPSEKLEVTGNVKATKFKGDGSELTNVPYPVTSVAGKTGEVTLAANDVGAQPKITVNGILQGDGNGNITAVESIGADIVTLDKSDVGLGNVDNTSDANKPISTATQTALDAKQDKITANGILKSDGEGTITAAEEAEVELVDLTIANVTGLQSALDANKGAAFSVTLASASWTGTAAPYTYTISNSAITATTNQELTPATDITADQLVALQAANIIDGGQAAGSMTLKAFGEKPSVDIPVRIIVKG
nr:MAG TPA: receptor binding complex [Caudoviricetes sp.]